MSRAEAVINFIEQFCRVPEGALVGSPLRLEPFQKEFIRDIYDNPSGTKRAYLSLARKNGKTALIACLVLGHLVGPEAKRNSQIVSGAMSREQASAVFNLAAKMVRLHPDFESVVRIIDSRKQLVGTLMNVEYRAIAAEGKTAHGLSPVLAILDEVGQIKGSQSPFVDAITTAQGAHENPLLIAISTQSAEDGDLFSTWLDDAEKSGDPRIVSHVYTAPADCELDDLEAWKAANPALGVFRSLTDVEQQADQAKRMPSVENTFRNLVLNQRVSTVSPFMSLNVWKSNGETPKPLEDCIEIHGGLDLSLQTDLTALVLVGRDAQGFYHVHPFFWTPAETLMDRARKDRQPYDVWVRQGFLRTVPGRTIEYDILAEQLRDITADLDVTSIAFDRWKIKFLTKELERIGYSLPLVECGQGFRYEQMPFCIDKTESVFLNGKVKHGMHPVLTANVANTAIVRDAKLNRCFEKAKSVSRIDGTVAMSMGIGQFFKAPEKEPEPTYQFFVLG